MGTASKQFLQKIAKYGKTRRASHQNHIMNPACPLPVLHSPRDDRPHFLKNRLAELAQKRIGENKAVLCVFLLNGNHRFLNIGQGNLCSLCLTVKRRAQGRRQAFLHKAILFTEMRHNRMVNIVAAQPVVPGNGCNLNDIFKTVHNAHI